MDARTPEDLGEKPPLTQADIRSIFYGLMLAMFLSALDGTIVATALPTMARDLGDVQNLPWIVTAYLLTSTAVTPLYGKLSDMYGRRATLLISIGIFVVGSLACAIAPTMTALALARGLQGVGGGGLIALAQIIIADIVSPLERGHYQVYFASVFAGASVLGPVLGGFFAESLHWSWIFWINLPLGGLTFVLVSGKLKKLPRHQRRHRLDLLGALLLVGATVTLMLAVSWGGHLYPWFSLAVLSLLGGSLLLWTLLVVRLLIASEPLIPIPVLANPVVAAGVACGALTMGIYVGLVTTVPVYFEAGLGLSARQSGLALIPFMVGVPLGATFSGRAMSSVTHYKRIPLIGLSLSAVSVGLFAFSPGKAPFWVVELQLGLAAIGLGTIFPVATVAVQNAVGSHHLGTATAVLNFMRQLLGALVVAVFGAIALSGSGLTLETLSGGSVADLSGFPTVFWLAAAGLAGSVVILALMEERPLRDRSALAEPSE